MLTYTGYLELNHEACEMLASKYVDIGTEDGAIVIRPGDSYIVSTFTTSKHNKLRGRIGGTGLVRSLVDAGVLIGDYHLTPIRDKKVVGHFDEQTHTVVIRKAKNRR